MVELEEFRHGGTNVTGYRLVDPEHETVKKVIDDWLRREARMGRRLAGKQTLSGDTIKVHGHHCPEKSSERSSPFV